MHCPTSENITGFGEVVFYVPQAATYKQARLHCARCGGQLIAPRDDIENSALLDYVQDIDAGINRIWIGADILDTST